MLRPPSVPGNCLASTSWSTSVSDWGIKLSVKDELVISPGFYLVPWGSGGRVALRGPGDLGPGDLGPAMGGCQPLAISISGCRVPAFTAASHRIELVLYLTPWSFRGQNDQ